MTPVNINSGNTESNEKKSKSNNTAKKIISTLKTPAVDRFAANRPSPRAQLLKQQHEKRNLVHRSDPNAVRKESPFRQFVEKKENISKSVPLNNSKSFKSLKSLIMSGKSEHGSATSSNKTARHSIRSRLSEKFVTNPFADLERPHGFWYTMTCAFKMFRGEEQFLNEDNARVINHIRKREKEKKKKEDAKKNCTITNSANIQNHTSNSANLASHKSNMVKNLSNASFFYLPSPVKEVEAAPEVKTSHVPEKRLSEKIQYPWGSLTLSDISKEGSQNVVNAMETNSSGEEGVMTISSFDSRNTHQKSEDHKLLTDQVKALYFLKLEVARYPVFSGAIGFLAAFTCVSLAMCDGSYMSRMYYPYVSETIHSGVRYFYFGFMALMCGYFNVLGQIAMAREYGGMRFREAVLGYCNSYVVKGNCYTPVSSRGFGTDSKNRKSIHKDWTSSDSLKNFKILSAIEQDDLLANESATVNQNADVSASESELDLPGSFLEESGSKSKTLSDFGSKNYGACPNTPNNTIDTSRIFTDNANSEKSTFSKRVATQKALSGTLLNIAYYLQWFGSGIACIASPAMFFTAFFDMVEHPKIHNEFALTFFMGQFVAFFFSFCSSIFRLIAVICRVNEEEKRLVEAKNNSRTSSAEIDQSAHKWYSTSLFPRVDSEATIAKFEREEKFENQANSPNSPNNNLVNSPRISLGKSPTKTYDGKSISEKRFLTKIVGFKLIICILYFILVVIMINLTKKVLSARQSLTMHECLTEEGFSPEYCDMRAQRFEIIEQKRIQELHEIHKDEKVFHDKKENIQVILERGNDTSYDVCKEPLKTEEQRGIELAGTFGYLVMGLREREKKFQWDNSAFDSISESEELLKESDCPGAWRKAVDFSVKNENISNSSVASNDEGGSCWGSEDNSSTNSESQSKISNKKALRAGFENTKPIKFNSLLLQQVLYIPDALAVELEQNAKLEKKLRNVVDSLDFTHPSCIYGKDYYNNTSAFQTADGEYVQRRKHICEKLENFTEYSKQTGLKNSSLFRFNVLFTDPIAVDVVVDPAEKCDENAENLNILAGNFRDELEIFVSNSVILGQKIGGRALVYENESDRRIHEVESITVENVDASFANNSENSFNIPAPVRRNLSDKSMSYHLCTAIQDASKDGNNNFSQQSRIDHLQRAIGQHVGIFLLFLMGLVYRMELKRAAGDVLGFLK